MAAVTIYSDFRAQEEEICHCFHLFGSHIWMWELDNKEGRALKNWCFWTVVLEKTRESPLESKEVKPDNLNGNQPWILFGRTGAEVEIPILWPPDANSWLIGKDSDAGKDWRQKEKRATEDEMVGWHHQVNGHELGQTLGDDEGQGGLECCSPWDYEELDMTWQLNNSINILCILYLFKLVFLFFSDIYTQERNC